MAATDTETQLLLRSTDASWSAERWERLPDDGNRYEVIDGVLYISTAPSWFHQWIVWQLMDLVGGQARRSGLGFPAAAPIGVFMPGCDPVQPDFLLVRSERSGIIAHGRVNGVPDLIAEVLSPSQPSYDTDVKRQAYARAGVPEYWIVRPASREVTIYWQPNQVAGEYAGALDIPPGGELASPTLPIRLAIAELFAGSPDTTV